MRRLAVAVLVAANILAAQPRARQAAGVGGRAQASVAVAKLLAQHEGLGGGVWGARIVNLSTGQTLYSKDADRFFTPASNAKLFATAYALSKLGPEHRFVTRLLATRLPGDDGTLNGDLIVVGGGDPTISGRAYPNQTTFDEIPDLVGDPMGPIDTLIRQIAAAGVRRIAGDIIGDDRAYVWEPYPVGWAEEDTLGADGAPVSALMFADNKVKISVRAGETTGERPSVTVTPETGYFHVTSLVETGARTRIQDRREPGSRNIELRGQVRYSDERDFAVDDPARYFAHVLRERLMERGIIVDGVAKARHRFGRESLEADVEKGVEIAKRESPPLANIVRFVNKASQNLHAEILLREAAREEGKAVSRTAAIEGLREFLGLQGIGAGEIDLSDGSGLSRLDLVTPEAVVKLLRAMQRSEHGQIWMSSLPVGGADGTLKDRFEWFSGHPERGKVMAKTGTLRHVTALSGFALTPAKQLLAFSVFANNVNASSLSARTFVDDLVTLFVK